MKFDCLIQLCNYIISSGFREVAITSISYPKGNNSVISRSFLIQGPFGTCSITLKDRLHKVRIVWKTLITKISHQGRRRRKSRT